MSEELLPCVHCGSTDVHPSYNRQPAREVFMLCYGCSAQGPRVLPSNASGSVTEDDWAKAIKLWNQRHIPQQLINQIKAEALEEFVRETREEIIERWIPTHAMPDQPDFKNFILEADALMIKAAKLRSKGEEG